MVAEKELSRVGQDSHVPRPDVTAGGLEKKTTTAAQHIDAIAIDVRSGNTRAAAHADVVGALDAGTAGIPVHEEIIEAVVVVDTGRFNRRITGQRIERRVWRYPFSG